MNAEMPANPKFGKNNARTGPGIRSVCGPRPAHATPILYVPQAGNLGRIQADGKRVGRP